MESNPFDSWGPFYTVFMLFAFVTAVLWFLLPFAVFGVKKRLDEANRLLSEIHKDLHARNRGPLPDSSSGERERVEPSIRR